MYSGIAIVKFIAIVKLQAALPEQPEQAARLSRQQSHPLARVLPYNGVSCLTGCCKSRSAGLGELV